MLLFKSTTAILPITSICREIIGRGLVMASNSFLYFCLEEKTEAQRRKGTALEIHDKSGS